MHSSLFCFSFHAFDTEALLPQVSRALETRTELVSREKVPGLWKVTDRLNDRPAPAESSPMRGRVLGIVFLVLGLLLFLPSAMQPKELLGPLVGGAVAILWGLWRIRVSMGSRGSSFSSAAKKLLAGKESITPEQQMRVEFSETDMTLSAAGSNPIEVPYSRISCAIETSDLFLLVFDNQATLLQKQDLTGGKLEEFRQFLAEKVSKYRDIS